jgi:hypothetical protein
MLKHFLDAGDRFRAMLAIALQANLLNLVVFGLTGHLEHEDLVFITLALTLVLQRLIDESAAPAPEPLPAPAAPAAPLRSVR